MFKRMSLTMISVLSITFSSLSHSAVSIVTRGGNVIENSSIPSGSKGNVNYVSYSKETNDNFNNGIVKIDAQSLGKNNIGNIDKVEEGRVLYHWNSNDNVVLDYINRNDTHIFKFAGVAYERGKPYRDYIIKKAREFDLPDEIFALAGVESNYVTNAKSRAGAIGMWQFMPPTAREFGLIDKSGDKRTDWKKSTDTAMAYIKHLRDDHFMGDMELTVLAYNAGLGKVKKAIEKHQTADVWVLIKDKSIFRQESIDYLPKFIAYFNFYEMLDEAIASR